MKIDFNYFENDKKEIERILSRRKHERFIKHCWQNKSAPFVVGLHTRVICDIIDKAMVDFAQGKSTFLVIKVPFRHGKSDMISRFLPPHFLGEFPDAEVLLATYGMILAQGFSRFNRNLINSDEYIDLYPHVKLCAGNKGVQQWTLEKHVGGYSCAGLGGSITGKGYHLGLLDDYCASRADAESEVIRNKTWESFTNDFLTRRAPVSITIVLATPWHVDDIIGRIEQRINPQSEFYDPEFPKFQVISFPAMNGDVVVNGKEVKYDYLFPERFSPEWYKQQFASLGAYSAQALLQCNPQVRGGALLDMTKIKIEDDVSVFPKTKYYRVWDLAHSAKQTQKDDPDWTSGTLLAYTKVDGLWHLWIKDVQRIRGKSPERDNLIKAVSEQDGQGVGIAVENSVDSVDAVSAMETIFNGRRVIKPLNIRIDKVARASYVEAIFETGHVHILRRAWNLEWIKEMSDFPSGKHDDQVDNVTAGYFLMCEGTKNIQTGKVVGI